VLAATKTWTVAHFIDWGQQTFYLALHVDHLLTVKIQLQESTNNELQLLRVHTAFSQLLI